jgi:hypothetical protein
LIEYYAIFLRASFRCVHFGYYFSEQPREVTESLQQNEAVFECELVFADVLRFKTVKKYNLLTIHSRQSPPMYLIILNIPPRANLDQIDRRSLLVLHQRTGLRKHLLLLLLLLITLEANQTINQIIRKLLVNAGLLMQKRLSTGQLLLVDKGLLPAAVLVDDELADGKLVAVMQSQIISPELALLNDAEIHSSKLQK